MGKKPRNAKPTGNTNTHVDKEGPKEWLVCAPSPFEDPRYRFLTRSHHLSTTYPYGSKATTFQEAKRLATGLVSYAWLFNVNTKQTFTPNVSTPS